MIYFVIGVLLDDLLVAEDLAAAETTTAASQAAAAAAASNVHGGRLPSRYFIDERTRQTMPEASPDGAVVVGNPVAPPVNGDMYTDISTENALLQGSRYVITVLIHWIIPCSFSSFKERLCLDYYVGE